MNHLSTTIEEDSRKKFLFLVESGIEPFLEKFDRAALRSNINEGRGGITYQRLQLVCTVSFKEDLKLMENQSIHHTILTGVTNVGCVSNQMRRAFKPLMQSKIHFISQKSL